VTSTGGTMTSTGGTVSSTGGTVTSTGGTVSSTGGTVTSTGGTVSNTGGTPTNTGGTPPTGGSGGGSAQGGSTSGGAAQGGAAGSKATGGAAGAGGAVGGACATAEEDKFSFFVISNAALIRECGPDSTGMYPACGGDLGGLSGADAKCQHVAEFVSPCQKKKTWHAFLSTSTVNAIDRIGTGPWYDRKGRLLATNITNLLTDRPTGADAAIRNDFPNEDGFPNQTPDGGAKIDNHELLTGTGADGKVYNQNASPGGPGTPTGCGLDEGASGTAMWSVMRATCWDWTRKTKEGCPRVGHPWCSPASCMPPGSGSGTNWMSVWNESGCFPGGNFKGGGIDTQSRQVGSAGGYGAFYCFAVTPSP
jgi:hypothetical protein